MKPIVTALFLCLTLISSAQNDRLKDENTIIWPQVFINIPLNKKWDLLTEYQWRRTQGLKDWQQSLLRTTIQYKLNPQVTIGGGYGWVKTFSYGDFPLAGNGAFPEHRIHEQVQLKNAFGKLSISQRLRIEQRFVGSMSTSGEVERWIFSNRFRYLLRLQRPLDSSGKLFVAAADEVFINAGKNVGVNVLDQNRFMFLLGAKPSSRITLEAGYISQTLIQGRRVNNRTIVQANRGVLVALYLNL